jgi:hypothetical protein
MQPVPGTFDPAQFLATSFEGEMNTKIIPIPEGEFAAVIKDINVRATDKSVVMDVTWGVDDETVRKTTGRESPTVKQGVFLTFDDRGMLDRDQNQQLARIREAVGQNTGGAWSPQQLLGQAARIKVAHKPGKNAEEGEVYANVVAVAKLG